MYNAGSQCFMSLGQGSGNGPLNGLVMGVSNAAHYITGRENLPMIFATNDTERLRITSAGNIGVQNTGASSKVHRAHLRAQPQEFETGEWHLVDQLGSRGAIVAGNASRW